MRLIYAYFPLIFGQSNNRSTQQQEAKQQQVEQQLVKREQQQWESATSSIHSAMQIESIQCNFFPKPEMNEEGNGVGEKKSIREQ